MKIDQFRAALKELDGDRNATFVFPHAETLCVHRAMLVPEESDHLVKLTDGKSIFIIDAERVAWVRIGLNDSISTS